MAMITKPSLAIVLVACLCVLAHLCAAIAPDDYRLEYLVPHNDARSKENVPPVVWNEEVAEFARSYAKQRSVDCLLEHSQNQQYGENLAMSTGEMSPAEAVKMWVDEKADYDYGSNSCTEGKMCGHYTQVVWRNTKSIGCAKAQCANGGTFITCNYSPPGNYIGERPY